MLFTIVQGLDVDLMLSCVHAGSLLLREMILEIFMMAFHGAWT